MKYRVEQEGQFLGHWQGHTPREAIAKAIANYGPFYNINKNGWFDIYTSTKHYRITGEE